MRGFLFDTNLVSEFNRPKPSPSVVHFVDAQPIATTFITDMVLAELSFGIGTVSDPAKAAQLQRWLEQDVRGVFAGRILQTTEASLLCWRHILEIARKSRVTFTEPDTLIAAIAQSHELVVATRDWKPFERVGTPTVDPWKALFRDGSGAPPMTVNLADPKLLKSIRLP